MRIYILLLLIALSCQYSCHSQITRINGYVVQKSNDSTQIQTKLNYVRIVNKDSIVLEEYETPKNRHGHSVKDGAYIKRNINGQIIETGTYQWNNKVGQWHYFFESGATKRIENYGVPFNNKYWHSLNTKILHKLNSFLDGAFVEFYSNGTIKKSGEYKLVDIKKSNFQLTQINSETYEEFQVTVNDEYWVPTSVKVGRWYSYDTFGELLEDKVHTYSNSTIIREIPRDPESREYLLYNKQ